MWTEVKRWRSARRARRERVQPPEAPRLCLEAGTARALVELSRGMSADWGVSIRHIVEFDANALGVARVSFWSIGEGGSSIRCDAGYVAGRQLFERGATLFQTDLPEYFAAMREATILNMPDVKTDARCAGLRDYCAARGISSMLDIPVWVEGRLVGVLCHEHVGPVRRWTEQEEDFAMGVGQLVSSALASRAHTEADAAAKRTAFLDELSRVILGTLESHEIASRAVGLAVPRVADIAMVYVLDHDGRLDHAASRHRDPSKQPLLLEAIRVRIARGERPSIASLVVSQKQSLLIPELCSKTLECYDISETHREAIHKLGIRSAMGVPLSVGDKTFGAMTFFSTGRCFTADDLALAEEVTRRVASALENARLYEIAREAIHARDEFLLLAAHELRTPLAALQLLSDDMLRRPHLPPEARDREIARRDAMARQVRRFAALVEHMLDALRIRAEGVPLALEPCDLSAIVAERVRRVEERANRAGSAIVLNAEPATVRCDRARIEQVVDELLDNAIKFGRERPIEVAVRRDGNDAEIDVRDHGAGVPRDRIQSVFSPFERAVPKEHFGGLGLGLFIAKAIVDAHGGRIAIDASVEDGARIVVRLPAE